MNNSQDYQSAGDKEVVQKRTSDAQVAFILRYLANPPYITDQNEEWNRIVRELNRRGSAEQQRNKSNWQLVFRKVNCEMKKKMKKGIDVNADIKEMACGDEVNPLGDAGSDEIPAKRQKLLMVKPKPAVSIVKSEFQRATETLVKGFGHLKDEMATTTILLGRIAAALEARMGHF